MDAFELWCWRRLLRVPWIARKANQSILKKIVSDYSLEKTLMLGKIEGRRRRGWQRVRWLDGITDSMDLNLSKLLQEIVKDRKSGKLQSIGSRDNLATKNNKQEHLRTKRHQNDQRAKNRTPNKSCGATVILFYRWHLQC